jgi:hypothetical protein
MKAYTFKYQNNSGLLYLLLVLIGIPLIMILLIVWLTNYVEWIFWPSIVLMITFMIFGVWRFVKKSKAIDSITLDEEGFTSQSYGRVRYQDIHSIPPYGILQAPPPSMRIKLNNGKMLVWLFNPDHPKSAAEAIIFKEFRDDLLRHLEDHATGNRNEQLSTFAGKDPEDKNDQTESVAKDTTNELISQLQESKNRDYKYIAIPISAVFAIVMLFRTCGGDFIRQQRNSESQEFRNGIQHMETAYEDNLLKAREVAAGYALQFGPVYLLTNDPKATIEFSPNIDKDPYAAEINVIGLRHVEDNKLLEEYIQHPDRVNYDLAVINTSLKFYALMNKGLFSRDDSTTIPVYLNIYNPTESLPNNFGRQAIDSTFRPIQFNTSIAVSREGVLKQEVLDNMDFASVRAMLQKYKGTYFYMVAKQQDGLSPQQFEKIKTLVMQNFEQHQIDTNRFESKIMNTR